MIKYDPNERISVENALKHVNKKYFIYNKKFFDEYNN